MKRRSHSLLIGLAAGVGGVLLVSGAAQAQCVTFDPVVLSGTFDPFNPSGTTVQTLSITARRPPAVGGKKTQEVNFIYLRRPDTPSSLTIIQTSTGGHILENYLRAKRQEWAEYISHVHPWEQERYLSEY